MRGATSWLLILFLGLSACSKQEEEAKEQVHVVETAIAQERDLPEYLRFVGTLKARYEVILYSKVSGKLLRYLVQEGDWVEEDQSIALIDRDQVGYKFQESPVDTPIAGEVGLLLQDVGENITETTPIALIVQLKEIEMLARIEERHIPRVEKGQKVLLEVEAYPNEIFEGSMFQVSPVVDRDSRTFLTRIMIPNQSEKLRPGMFAKGKVIVGEIPEAVLVPEAALTQTDAASYVIVVEDSIAKKREVTTGVRTDGLIQITSGIAPGDEVVIAGAQRLTDGSRVRVVR